jgi:hypothetical protein
MFFQIKLNNFMLIGVEKVKNRLGFIKPEKEITRLLNKKVVKSK